MIDDDAAKAAQATETGGGSADPGHLTTVDAPHSTSRNRGREREGTNALVVVLIALFLAGGLYEIAHGGASASSDPARFPDSTTTAPLRPGSSVLSSGASALGALTQATIPTAQGPTVAVDPCLADNTHVSVVVVFFALKSREAPFVALAPTSVEQGKSAGADLFGQGSTASACATLYFVDTRTHGYGRLLAYASVSDAARSTDPSGLGRTSIAVGNVVLDLDASQTPFRTAYETAVTVALSPGNTATSPSHAATSAPSRG